MSSFDEMRLTPNQVAKRRLALEHICDNLERFVQGIDHGKLQWEPIIILARQMLLIDHHKREYMTRQNVAKGSVGFRLKNSTPDSDDGSLYTAWIIQVGTDVALNNYNDTSLQHLKLDAAQIDDILTKNQAGDAAIAKYNQQRILPTNQQDLEFMTFFENRQFGVRNIVNQIMDHDLMFVLDPYALERLAFRVRVSAFYVPSCLVRRLKVKDQHIMDRHLVIERLRALQHIAVMRGSWIANHIADARAAVIKMETYDDIHVISMFLCKGTGCALTTESAVILVSVAMWMHSPRGLQAVSPMQFRTFNELIRIIDMERQSRPEVDNMWKGPDVDRPHPVFPSHFDEAGPLGLVESCTTEAGLEFQRQLQLKGAADCRWQIETGKSNREEAETKERFRQEAEAEAEIRRLAGKNAEAREKAETANKYRGEAEQRRVQEARDGEMQRSQEKQEAPTNKNNISKEQKKVLDDVFDEINADGQLGDDSRWFWRVMEALADPDQPFDAQGLDYLDSPGMMNDLSSNVLRRLTGYVQRRKDYGDILGKLLDGRITTVEGLGPMTGSFQLARIAVDKCRADIPCCRAGRGLLMLRMMVASLESTRPAVLVTAPAPAALSPDPPLVASPPSDRAAPVATDTTTTTALNSASVQDAAPSRPNYSEFGSMTSGRVQSPPTESSRVRGHKIYMGQHRGGRGGLGGQARDSRRSPRGL